VVRRTWFSSFQGDSRAVSVFTDSKSAGWEKVGNISVESCDQIFKEIRRIQGRSIPEPRRKLTKLELNIDNDVNIISFLSNYPHFFGSKTNLLYSVLPDYFYKCSKISD